ncbi:MAG: helix-turn-helix domain-containing protein [Melioribacteraceae bacterium]|jgi:excisionase family DNA binding protein|nr:helix-turn-helix domain-containing protein [Melioribacteraceae bacterium]
MQNMILTPVSVEELVNLIACEVETRIHRVEPKEPPQDRISLDEACLITGSSKSQVYKLSMLNEIPHQKFGKRLVFSRKSLNEWMEKRTISAPEAGDVMTDRLAKSAKKHLNK